METSMDEYVCHKRVKAARITDVVPTADGSGHLLGLEGRDPDAPDHFVDVRMTARYMPTPGDYLVVYEDGYRSISPRKAFEEGYRKVGAPLPLNPEAGIGNGAWN